MSPRTNKSYTPEFREQAVRLLTESGRSAPEVAKQLGISDQSLRNWAKQSSIDAGVAPGLTSAERDELRELRKKTRDPTEENEFLKKAAAFFAAETDSPRRKRHSG